MTFKKAVAWAVTPTGHSEEIDAEFIYSDRDIAYDIARESAAVIVPLYCRPQAALTDEEQDAVLYFSGHYAGFYGKAMLGLAMRLGLYDLPRYTPDTNTTPAEGSVQGEGTLTAEEREAIHRAEARLRTAYVPDDQTAATLRNMLERLPAH